MILSIQTKVSDRLGLSLIKDGKTLHDQDDYVPDCFPDQHFGDYLYLDVDLNTGKIVNWNIKETKLWAKQQLKKGT